jgi:hypothetical protein
MAAMQTCEVTVGLLTFTSVHTYMVCNFPSQEFVVTLMKYKTSVLQNLFFFLQCQY